jgi:hypothetical protein
MNVNAPPTLHVVFNMSAAGTIRQALEQIGRRERVIGLPDNLSFGPIDPPSARSRWEWAEQWLDCEYEEVAKMADLFWAEAKSPDIVPVVWVCRHCASEYAGFLEFVWRRADAPLGVVDATGPRFVGPGQSGTRVARSLGVMTRKEILDARPTDRQTTLRAQEIESYRATWRRLRKENAPLRIIDDTGLVSAPISYFDDVLLSCATDAWGKAARVVGATMAKLWERPHGDSPSDMLLWARLLALADAGTLEISGDGSDIQQTLVRQGPTPSRSAR